MLWLSFFNNLFQEVVAPYNIGGYQFNNLLFPLFDFRFCLMERTGFPSMRDSATAFVEDLLGSATAGRDDTTVLGRVLLRNPAPGC